jgi:DNA-binding winged helix-turn-helix (wHTH) protein/TolB-like protein
VLRFSGFELDSERAELRRPDGETVKLRPKTLEILRLLAGNAGRVLSKQQLMDAAWPNVHVGEDSLFQCIREIRTALGDDKRQVVRVISGRGYLFQAEVTGAQATEAGVTEVAAPEIAPVSQPERASPDTTVAVATTREPAKRLFDFSRRRIAFAFVAGLAILCTAVAVWMLRPGLIFARGPATIAVMPIADESNDPLVAQMAADVSGRLTDGLAKIENIRVLAPETGAPKADFVLKGELQKSEQAWTIRTRMTNTATSEVTWTASYQVNPSDTDLQMLQSRLAAGVGSRAGATHQRIAECRHAIRCEEQGRDRTGDRPYQPDLAGTFSGGAGDAGEGAGRRPRQCRDSSYARGAVDARRADGVAGPRRARSGRDQG